MNCKLEVAHLLNCMVATDLHIRYHHLNHHAIFGAGYKSGAISIMEKLLKKYG
jgi:hypothetical protein